MRIPVPTPFPVGDVNAYLLARDPVTLIDCGPSTDEAWEALVEGLRAAGTRPEDVRRLVLTHPHHDHAGLSGRIRRLSGCTVYASPDAGGEVWGASRWAAVVEFLCEACRRAGAPAARIGEMRARFEIVGRYADPPDEVASLGEGDWLGFAGAAFRVLHTPGHASGAVCLWAAEPGLLLSGDTLIPHISSNAVLEPAAEEGFRRETLLEYLETLVRLRRLRPRSVLPGHGEEMVEDEAGIRRLIDDRLDFHDRRAEKIRSLVDEGLRSPWQIAERLFPDLEAEFTFLGVSEVVGHLDLLARRGQIDFRGQREASWSASPRSTSSSPP